MNWASTCPIVLGTVRPVGPAVARGGCVPRGRSGQCGYCGAPRSRRAFVPSGPGCVSWTDRPFAIDRTGRPFNEDTFAASLAFEPAGDLVPHGGARGADRRERTIAASPGCKRSATPPLLRPPLAAGADVLVAQGGEAGGNCGSIATSRAGARGRRPRRWRARDRGRRHRRWARNRCGSYARRAGRLSWHALPRHHRRWLWINRGRIASWQLTPPMQSRWRMPSG